MRKTSLVLSAIILVVLNFPARAQVFKVLYTFQGTSDGASPLAGLTMAAPGNFYGTAGGWQYGSTPNGVVFNLANDGSTWNFTTLYAFAGGTDGEGPDGTLTFGPDGSLYGDTVEGGGSNSCGVIYNLSNASGRWLENIAHSFNGQTDGCVPVGQVVFDPQGNLYGSTAQGPHTTLGTVYQLSPSAGGWTENILYEFPFSGANGGGPSEPLLDKQGNVYGTAMEGGSNNAGVFFELSPAGQGWTEQTLYSFGQTDGGGPTPLVADQFGNLYGGVAPTILGPGAIFEMSPSASGWTLSYLYTYTTLLDPIGPLTLDAQGNLYGAFINAGAGFDSIYELTKLNGAWTFSTLYQFSGGSDGMSPNGGLVIDADGSIYGTTALGGDQNHGVVYQLGPQYVLSVSTFGNGKVTSTDGFIDCPGTCTHSYPPNTQVTLNATPAQGQIFPGWSGACSGTGPCALTITQPLAVGASFTQPLGFVTVPPCRLVDTRKPNGEFGGPPIPAGGFRSFVIPDNQTCNIPAAAVAYSLNVTAIPHGALGYLTIWPTGATRPVISTLNSLDGRIKADATIIPAGAGDAVSVFATNTTDLVLDIDGYFAPVSSSTLSFYPWAPCRVFDTRKADGDLGGPPLAGNTQRNFPVLEASACDIPSTAQAYSLNFTAIPLNGGPLNYLTVWAAGELRPTVSTLNDQTGTVVANAAIVPAGTGGAIAVYPSDNTNLVADINGYFAPAAPGGLSLYPVLPCRVLDTRKIGDGQPFSGVLNPPVDVTSSGCGIAENAEGYVFNATVVPNGALYYLTLWPDGENQPVVSTLNALDGAITSNMAIVPTSNGKIDAYAAGSTQLILDISSYFAP